VDRAEDETPVGVQELTFLPIHFSRYMGAAVEITHHGTAMAQHKGTGGPPLLLHVEDVGPATLFQFGGGAKVYG
jgi:hypothetical protein